MWGMLRGKLIVRIAQGRAAFPDIVSSAKSSKTPKSCCQVYGPTLNSAQQLLLITYFEYTRSGCCCCCCIGCRLLDCFALVERILCYSLDRSTRRCKLCNQYQLRLYGGLQIERLLKYINVINPFLQRSPNSRFEQCHTRAKAPLNCS